MASTDRRRHIQIGTKRVSTNVGTKQALLSAVPVGKKRIVTGVVARNASATLATMAGALTFGFSAGANDQASTVTNDSLSVLTNSTGMVQRVNLPEAGGDMCPVGASGEVLGCKFADTSITATLDIDVHYYDADA